MRGMKPAQALWLSVVCLVTIGIAAMLMASSAMAQTETPPGDVKPGETVQSSPGPTVPPTGDLGTGGIVVSPPPTEPTATEPVEEGEIPDETEGVPTDETDNEGVAPAVVVVVLRTADGGSVSDRTTVCVSEICQPVGAVASGTKIEFERIIQGWQDISIVDAGPYENGFSSVSVRPGQLHTVEVTLSLARRVKEVPPTPPPGATGPIRAPIQVADQDAPVARESSARFTANVSGTDEAVLRINALPATGAGEPAGSNTSGFFVLGAALTMLQFALLARWRATGGPAVAGRR